MSGMDFIKRWGTIVAVGIFLITASLYWPFPALRSVEQNVVVSQNAVALHAVDLLNLFLDRTFQDLAHFGGHIVDGVGDNKKLSELFFRSRGDFLNLLVFEGIRGPEAKGVGLLNEQRYLKIIHYVTHERE